MTILEPRTECLMLQKLQILLLYGHKASSSYLPIPR